MTTRVIITGDRSWKCDALARRIVDRLKARYGDGLVLIHGACAGVDMAFDVAAIWAKVTKEPHPADWGGYGSRAGPKRNREMVAKGAAFLIAVHRDLKASKGTRGCVTLAMEAGIPCYLIDSEEGEPRRINTEDLV